MSSFGADILTNVLAGAVIFALGWTARVPIMLLVGGGRRRRQLRFFGVTRLHTRQVIYLSTLFVRPSGALDFKDESRSFQGRAVPEYELEAVQLFHDLWRNRILDSLSARVRTNFERFGRLRRIEPDVRLSPHDATAIQRGGSIVCVGSQYYNSATALFFDTLSPTLVIRDGLAIVSRGADGEVVDEWSALANPPTDFAIVERLTIAQTRTTVFIVAGLGTVGTTGAMAFLAKEWPALHKEFGDGPFAMCLSFTNVFQDPDSHLKPKLMFKTLPMRVAGSSVQADQASARRHRPRMPFPEERRDL